MLRVLAYIVAIALFVAGAVWVADRPGFVTIDWMGWRLEASTGVLLLLLAIAVVAILIVIRLWDLIWHAPRRMMRARAERRRVAGYRALTKGMVAVAAGDAAEAKRQARSAHGLLGEPPLTLLLAAQAAQLNGDDSAAQRYFNAMLERRDMRFLGLRGLLNQALARGDDVAALDYARRAHRERPDAEWPVVSLVDLQVKLGEWSGAATTINDAMAQKLIEKPEGRRRLAALFVEEARKLAASNPVRALELAREALKRRPDLVPAIQLEAALLHRAGRDREAKKRIEQAWGGTPGPHPLLAASYAALEPDEQPLLRLRRFETLAAKAPQHRESRLALAEMAIAAELWAPARQALEPVLREEERLGAREQSARVARLMAALEHGEHADATAARRWLAMAATAQPDPGWICSVCHDAMGDWRARCPHCGAFDSAEWRSTPAPSVRSLAPAATASVPAVMPDRAVPVPAADDGIPARVTPAAQAAPRPAPAEETPAAPQVDAARLVN